VSPTAPTPANQNPGAPRNPGALGGTAAFGQLVHTAIQDQSRTADPAWILRSGELAPQLLCRYAVGQVSAPERRAVQELVTRHDWARGRVTSLVMSGRADAPDISLGRSVLAGAKGGNVDPYRIACAAALRSLEAPEAASAVENDDREAFEKLELTGLAQALCELAFSEDRTQARQGLANESSSDEAVALALRVAASHDEDEALVELLQAI
jgi:hypothetical protein